MTDQRHGNPDGKGMSGRDILLTRRKIKQRNMIDRVDVTIAHDPFNSLAQESAMSMPPANPYENQSMPTSGNSYIVGRRTIKTLKRIEPLSVAKIQGALMALFGLIGAAVFIMITIVGVASGGMQGPGNQAVAGIVGMLIGAVFVPIIYGVLGFIGGLIGALIYNLCASLMGGIEMEFEE